MKNHFQIILNRHREAFDRSFSGTNMEILERIAREILKSLKADKKVLLCGNGGSAADCQHIAAELIVRFARDRRSLPAIALTTDTSILTAAANDYGYDSVFARQVEGLGQTGDILIAISTSGKSKSVLAAVETAKTRKVHTIGFTGADGGSLKNAVDICFQAQAAQTQHIQEIHSVALHAISEVVDNTLFG